MSRGTKAHRHGGTEARRERQSTETQKRRNVETVGPGILFGGRMDRTGGRWSASADRCLPPFSEAVGIVVAAGVLAGRTGQGATEKRPARTQAATIGSRCSGNPTTSSGGGGRGTVRGPVGAEAAFRRPAGAWCCAGVRVPRAGDLGRSAAARGGLEARQRFLAMGGRSFG